MGAIPGGVPTDCAQGRGGLFNLNDSTTYADQGWYGINGGDLGFEANLGVNGNQFFADYATDTLGLGFQEEDAPTLKGQTIAGYQLPNPYYLYCRPTPPTGVRSPPAL